MRLTTHTYFIAHTCSDNVTFNAVYFISCCRSSDGHDQLRPAFIQLMSHWTPYSSVNTFILCALCVIAFKLMVILHFSPPQWLNRRNQFFWFNCKYKMRPGQTMSVI